MSTNTEPTHNADQMPANLSQGNTRQLSGYAAKHFLWSVADGVATITLNRPERKTPSRLTAMRNFETCLPA